MSPAILGFVRAIGSIILMAVLAYLGDVSHLNGIVSASLATVIAGIAMSVEHMIEAKSGNALFGAVRSEK